MTCVFIAMVGLLIPPTFILGALLVNDFRECTREEG